MKPAPAAAATSVKKESEIDTNPGADQDSKLPVPLQLQEPELEEKTTIGFVNAQPFVRIFNSKNQKTMDIRLTGQRWKGGRSPDLQIVLDENAASRVHFEIKRNPRDGGFEIVDLGSSNGTRLNGELLDENRVYPMVSGDIIGIGGTTIEFQVRDASYTSKLQEAGLIAIPQQSYDMMIPQGGNVRVIGGPAYGGGRGGGKKFSPKPIHYILMGILALIIISSMGGDKTETDLGSKTGDGVGGPGEAPPQQTKKLSPQQQKFLEDTYNLADSLFKRGKYEVALIEIRKIHELVPDYKRSKQLEAFCQQAIDTAKERDEYEMQQQREQEIRNNVRSIVEECRKRLNSTMTVSMMERCLVNATELDPENAEAQSLIERVRKQESDREQKSAQKAAYNSGVAKMGKLYDKAVGEEKAGKLLDAISSYQNVLNSDLPDPKNLKGKAKTQLASVKASLDKEISKAEDNATDLYSKEKFKEALIECQKALDLNPANTKVKSLYDKIYNDLKKRLKAIYGDSVLEESLGNIEAAKQKWNTIIDLDLESGEYYQKAKRMMKKYGG